MRETLGVPPVVPAKRRSSSRIPLWSWLFAAAGLALMVLAAIVVERSLHCGHARAAAPARATTPPRAVCDAAAQRLADVARQAEQCGDAHAAESFRAARAEILLAHETAHDDASEGEVYIACVVALDLPDFVCR